MLSPTSPNSAIDYGLPWLLDLLEQHGYIQASVRRDIEVQAPQQKALLVKKKTAGHERLYDKVSPAELLASFELADEAGQVLDEDRLAELTAQAANLPYCKIDPLKLDMQLVTQTLSRPFATRHGVLPLHQDDEAMVVALDNPFDTEVIENLRLVAGKPVRCVVASKRDILKCITEIYGFRQSVESAAALSAPAPGLFDFEQLVRLRSVGDIAASDEHVVNAVDFLLAYAFDLHASDIHLEPHRDNGQVRLRIDGVLHNVHTVPRRVVPALVSRIKTLCRMDITERRRPQDGRIKTVLNDKSIEIRVSTMPTALGEKVVMRIFDPDVLLQDLSDLGLEPTHLSRFEHWISQPHGLILITGPTGSGKTTTLYTALKTLADSTVNITTIEDPIEMVTDLFNQVAVQPKIGLDFPAALRTLLRQDPDVIMVGEIRDTTTANMAVQAALTGHLVFATLHTNDACSAIARMRDLEVPVFLLAQALVGVMAQRLLRRICHSCKALEPLSQQAALALGIADKSVYSRQHSPQIPKAVGCAACRNTGYLGRIGIFELLHVLPPLREQIATQNNWHGLEMLHMLQQQGMQTLRQAAQQRLFAGETSYNEVLRILGPA